MLQAHSPSAPGAGMKRLWGARFFIWWMMPGSVAMMKSLPSAVTAKSRIERVEPI